MKALAVATFILGILVTPLYAQQNSVQFNGMVFDTPPTAGSETPQTPAKPKTSHHAKKRTHHKGSAS
jgi:hypothetical protein